MLSQNKIKFVRSLDLKKNRYQNNCFTVEGEKMVVELLQSSFQTIELFATQTFLTKYASLIGKAKLISEINDAGLKKISHLKTPNMAMAVVEIPDNNLSAHTFSSLNIALDTVQDPGNLGTIIRTSNWFGVENIFCSPDTVDAYNSKVIQSTMGAIFRTRIFYTPLDSVIETAKNNNQKVYGAFLDGKNIYTENLSENALIVLGNESNGISADVEKLVDQSISIPTFSSGLNAMESLNVGIAHAVVLAEFKRRHLSV